MRTQRKFFTAASAGSYGGSPRMRWAIRTTVIQGEKLPDVLDLIVPLPDRFDFGTVWNTSDHAEAGIDLNNQDIEIAKPEGRQRA